jgi:hypothetical protein
MIVFNKGKKYRFGQDSVIDWVYVGKCTNGSAYDTYTFVDRKNHKRKQYKRNELKDLNIFLNEN